MPRLDIPEKVNGSAVFGLDVKLPGLLVARVVRCPVFGGKVASFNAGQGEGRRRASGTSCRSAAASPSSPTITGRRRRASRRSQSNGTRVALATLNSADITKKYAELAEQPGQGRRATTATSTRRCAKGAATQFERVFEVPFLAHATMEPMNCTADVRADRCDVWVPTQGQTASQQAAIGGSAAFRPTRSRSTRRISAAGSAGAAKRDFVTDAVETSKAVGAPVKVVWTREDDMQHDYYRPVTYVRMWGGARRSPASRPRSCSASCSSR